MNVKSYTNTYSYRKPLGCVKAEKCNSKYAGKYALMQITTSHILASFNYLSPTYIKNRNVLNCVHDSDINMHAAVVKDIKIS